MVLRSYTEPVTPPRFGPTPLGELPKTPPPDDLHWIAFDRTDRGYRDLLTLTDNVAEKQKIPNPLPQSQVATEGTTQAPATTKSNPSKPPSRRSSGRSQGAPREAREGARSPRAPGRKTPDPPARPVPATPPQPAGSVGSTWRCPRCGSNRVVETAPALGLGTLTCLGLIVAGAITAGLTALLGKAAGQWFAIPLLIAFLVGTFYVRVKQSDRFRCRDCRNVWTA